MIEQITRANIENIPNAPFRKYAAQYLDIREDFMRAIAQFGLDVSEGDPDVRTGELAQRVEALRGRGVAVANDRKSFCAGWISPSCVACRHGLGTETFLTSTQCPRDCYFCFNPNQGDYEYYQTHVKDIASDLVARAKRGMRLKHLGITGGEPLLHPDVVLAFLGKARELYPEARVRLYTSGSGLTESLLGQLVDGGLDEIRFSIKLEDKPALIKATLDKISQCKAAGLDTMVEMPVMPDQVEQMKELLLSLEGSLDGINLLEMCFPFNNAHEFAKRGYRIKSLPYRVIYDYWYAGGLPVSGSEEACFDLLEFAVDRGLSFGVHYCSLENKVTGQVFQQNWPARSKYPLHLFSERDYFLKSAKVFGNDINRVGGVFRAEGITDYKRNKQLGYMEFPLAHMGLLARELPGMPVAVSTNVVEYRKEGPVMRELTVDLAFPATFDLAADV